MPSILAIALCYPPAPGGAEASLHETLERLVARGADARVATVRDCPALERSFRDVAPHEVRGGVRIRRYARGEFVARLQAELPDCDMVFYQLHQQCLGAGFAMNKLLAPHRARTVYFVRAHSYDLFPAALLVANSQWIANDFLARTPALGDRTLVLTPPIQPPVHPAACARRFVTLVNPLLHKGGDVLRALAERLPDVAFLAQQGWGAQMVDGLSALPNVTCRPPTERIGDTYADTRVLLVPSKTEPFGRVALEGALAGCLVLAHQTQGLCEVPLPAWCRVHSLSIDEGEQRLLELLALSPEDDAARRQQVRAQALTYDCGFERFAATLADRFSPRLAIAIA
jgi:glycosyltransferase involved in cell wall biosynthesis